MTRLANRIFKFERNIDIIAAEITNCQTFVANNNFDYFYLERLIIQLQIEFELFVRGVILDSATGKFTNSKGKVISKSYKISSREQAANILVSKYTKRNKEPDWYLPTQSIDAAQKLDLSNFAEISAILGVTPWMVNDLRYLRNFIAHQSKSASITAKNNLLISRISRREIKDYCYSYHQGGKQQYRMWVDFIKFIANQLTN